MCASLGLRAQSTLIRAINENSFSIKYIQPEESISDISLLKSIFLNKYVIGLGEATHGTHEYYIYKHRLIRYLVQELGFKKIILETDFAGTKTLNSYVVDGIGNPKQGMYDMDQGVFETQEFLDMIEWIRFYNSTKANEDKVRIYGCDTQGGPTYSARNILSYFKEKQMVLSPELQMGLEILQNWKYRDASIEGNKSFEKTLLLLRYIFPVKNISDIKPEYCEHQIRALEQYWFFNSNPRLRSHLRDTYMAENCKWIISTHPTEKTIIWAHNSHIQKETTLGDIKPMGQFLDEIYGKTYYAMAFGYDYGTLRAYDLVNQRYNNYEMTTSLKKNSSTYIFKQVNEPNFIFDFQNAGKNDELRNFLNKKIWFRELGALFHPEREINQSYCKITLIKSFDGLIFFRETSASHAMFNGKFITN